MRTSISKSLVAGAATIALSAVAALTSVPAGAALFHGGGGFSGVHGGFGGFHGGMGGFGAFHGPAMGAFRPGVSAFHRFGFGFHHGFFDRDDFFHRRFVFNRNVFFGGPGCWSGWCGFATGAVIGAAATYPYDYGYGCWVYRPVYRYGVYVGRRPVNICY